MKTPEDEKLSQLLAGWNVSPRRDPQFRAAVQARLERGARRESWPAFARTHAAFVAGALAAAIVLGGWAGRDQAKERVDHDRAEIAAAYVQSYDARAMERP